MAFPDVVGGRPHASSLMLLPVVLADVMTMCTMGSTFTRLHTGGRP